jgi:hypothetical protein
VSFVLPKDFEGVIYVKQQPDGPDMTRTSKGYSIVVPENGVVAFRNTEVFAKWHTETAKYEDGKTIPLFDEDVAGSVGQVYFRSLWRDSTGVSCFVVGPWREIKPLISGPGDIPPGRVNWSREKTASRPS